MAEAGVDLTTLARRFRHLRVRGVPYHSRSSLRWPYRAINWLSRQFQTFRTTFWRIAFNRQTSKLVRMQKRMRLLPTP